MIINPVNASLFLSNLILQYFMAVSNRLKNQHLLWRAGFGPMAENAAALDTVSSKDLWKLLEKTSAKKPDKIEVAQNLADGLYKGIMDVAKM